MKKIIVLALAVFYSSQLFATTTIPVPVLDPTGSTTGQAILSTGASSAPAWGSVVATALTGAVPVANGGTNCSSASGTCLDNVAGFSSTGFLTRTGAGAYAFQSATNGITLGNLAQQSANTVLGNSVGATGTVVAIPVPSCSTSVSALTWTSGTGFSCNTGLVTAATVASTYAPIAGNSAATFSVANAAAAQNAEAHNQSVSSGALSNVTASRALGTTYTNALNRPIYVYVTGSSTAASTTLQAMIGGANVGLSSTVSAASVYVGISFLVPPGATYSVGVNTGTATLFSWTEIR